VKEASFCAIVTNKGLQVSVHWNAKYNFLIKLSFTDPIPDFRAKFHKLRSETVHSFSSKEMKLINMYQPYLFQGYQYNGVFNRFLSLRKQIYNIVTSVCLSPSVSLDK
jgi:hypothetical protein